MNKKAKKRAFFICAAIFVMYVMVGLGLTDKLSMKRIANTEEIATKTMGFVPSRAKVEIDEPQATAAVTTEAPPAPREATVPAQKPPVFKVAAFKSQSAPEPKQAPSAKVETPAPQAEVVLPVASLLRDMVSAEPSLFISIPIVCYAIREGLIEKEGLIFIKKGGYGNGSWKKPLDILKDKDEEGLKSISKAIGKKQILGFLRKEGITHTEGAGTDDVILGRGYGVEKKKLLDLYGKYVSADYQAIFPFFLGGVGITKGKGGFDILRPKDAVKERREEGEEWMMPNLANLPIRDAIAKISVRTSKIKVHGSGSVIDQQPKPFQRTHGETECIIYGRMNKQ
jgi:hypothetical protein